MYTGNNFYSSLKYEDAQKIPADNLYKRMGFYNIRRCSWDTPGGKKLQREDVDLRMRDRDGKILNVSEKFRTKDWGDIAIEIFSTWDPKNKTYKPGWGISGQSDYIFYHTPDTLYIVNTDSLKRFLQSFGLDRPLFYGWLELGDAAEPLLDNKPLKIPYMPFKCELRSIKTTIMGSDVWRGLILTISWDSLYKFGLDIKIIDKKQVLCS